MTIPWDDSAIKAWLENASRDMLPKMESSACAISIYSGKVDPKLCLEVGAAILLNKPIVLLVPLEQGVPWALERAAACIVRGDAKDPATQKELSAALEWVLMHKIERKA